MFSRSPDSSGSLRLKIEPVVAVAEALAARVNIYVLHLDPPDHADAAAPRVFSTFVEDREMMSEGLEFMAGVGRGALFRTTGNAEFAFTQIANELAGSYLLTIEPQPSDRDGRTHDIEVRVNNRDAKVRARRNYLAGKR